jgi:hypothetical protein
MDRPQLIGLLRDYVTPSKYQMVTNEYSTAMLRALLVFHQSNEKDRLRPRQESKDLWVY